MKRLFNGLAFLSLGTFLVSITLPFDGTWFFLGRNLIAYLYLWPFLLMFAAYELIWHRDTPLPQSNILAFISPLPTINILLLIFLILRRKRARTTSRLLSSVAACVGWVVAIEFGEPTILLCIWSASITLAFVAIWVKP